jgi:hypothetical protein
MTTKEEKIIETLLKAVQDLRTENQKFRDDVKSQVEAINTKTEKKHLPVTLEQDILKATQMAIGDCISKIMVGYDSPLIKLVKSVIDENSTALRLIISDSFTKVISTDEFKQSVVSAFSHKVARTVISNNDGLFDRVSNELKQDSVFKAKMALAVSNVVEECLKDRK